MPDTPTVTAENGDPQYQSYLLRLWQEAPGGEPRALLQDVLSGNSRSFPSLDRLFAYLGAAHRRPKEKEDIGLS